MAKKRHSIFTNDFHTCHFTDEIAQIEVHHIFGGSHRKHSEEFGFIIPVVHWLHNEPPFGIHHNRAVDLQLKQYCQRWFEKEYPREEFIRVFGQSYIYDDDNDGYEINLKALGVPLSNAI